MTLYYPTTTNANQKTLDAALNAGVTASATLNNTTGIQNKKGVFVVDRVDTNGVLTPNKREYIGFTGTSGSTVVTLTRNIDGGGSDQDHAVGAIVEFGPDAVWADGVMDALDNLVDATGAVDTTKVVTLTGTQTLTNKTLTSPKINEDVALTASATELNLLDGVTSLPSDDGWITGTGTWTYATADDPTFTLTVNADVTSKIGVGDRIKLTQTTAKYFIVTAISYSDPNTTITLYGGTDYDLANAAITSPYFSHAKSPVGFPVDRIKWEVTASDATERSQASPVQNTWYNINTLLISLPIGSWDVHYRTYVGANNDSAAGVRYAQSTLSTANNSESDAELTGLVAAYDIKFINGPTFARKTITVASKTSYYLNARTTTASLSNLYRGQAYIRAVSCYL